MAKPSPLIGTLTLTITPSLGPALAALLDAQPPAYRERIDLEAVTAALSETAAEFDAAADRAFTLADEDGRRRAAAQLRFVGVLVRDGNSPGIGEPWITAAKAMLTQLEEADMNEVHASRASRRNECATHPSLHAHDPGPACAERLVNGVLLGACTVAPESTDVETAR